MLYQLFSWLDKSFNIPGTGMFQFLTFRIAMAILLSLFIATVYGKKMILFLQKKQIGESVRELGLAGEQQKKGTPTMGGIIILMSVLIPTLLFANLDKVYIRLMVLCTVWLGIIGFLDDYFKIRARKEAQEKEAQESGRSFRNSRRRTRSRRMGSSRNASDHRSAPHRAF